MIVRNAVVLICDKNFFVPTFATALSAGENLTRDDTCVQVLVTDGDQRWCSQFGSLTAQLRISIAPAPVPEIAALQRYHRDRYLPAVALSRFWLHRFLAPEIERFLYLDGDILVDGSLDDIFDAEIPEGGMLAAPDTVCLCVNELGRGPQREKVYLQRLGVKEDSYFNSGVILASRRGWSQIAEKAVNFLVENSELCRSSDQSALNAVAGHLCRPLSLRWNYQSDHMTLLDPRSIGVKPVIWHFTGAPKPWHRPEWPWDESFNRAYRKAQQLLADLNIEDPKPSPAQLKAGLAHRRRARLRLRWFYPWRQFTRGLAIRRQIRV